MWKVILIAIWLGILAFMDIRRRWVPVWLLAVSSIFVTCVSAYEIWQGSMGSVEILWGILPGFMLLLTAVFSNKAGWADGVVLLLLGGMTGFRECTFSFILSMLAISVTSLTLLVIKRVGKNTKIPYLPFLWIGYLAQTALKFAD